MKPALVIVSHYNAWPTDQLVALLDQMQAIPPGHPFRCRVVVNQAEDKPLELPSRHSAVEVFYRENVGYNIGAWEYGWRQPSDADEFLFLQEECQILRPNWLRAFLELVSRPEIGLVGETVIWRGYLWDRVDYYEGVYNYPDDDDGGPMLTLTQGVRKFLARKGIVPGPTGEHVQSLVIAARRDVLEAVGGFLVGRNKAEAIASEVAISRAVVAKGLKLRQIGIMPFRYILHPQWDLGKPSRLALLRGYVQHYMPDSLSNSLRRTVHGLRKKRAGHASNG
jgi:hypothetical protein